MPVRSAVVVVALALFALARVCAAKDAQPLAADPALEARAMAIAEELRCLVCQNQTLADSHADLAIDLKNQIREKLAAGMSDKAIVAYMVERYGDFVLYRPPVKATTVLLWFGPFLLLVAAIAFLIVQLRRRSRAPQAAAELNEAERERARSLLGEPSQRA
jgi:cytochrome c-type biogenesis protein CcmH